MVLNAFLQLLNLLLLFLLEFSHFLYEFSLLHRLFSVYLCSLLSEFLQVKQILYPQLLNLEYFADGRVRVLSQFVVQVCVYQIIQIVIDGVQVSL